MTDELYKAAVIALCGGNLAGAIVMYGMYWYDVQRHGKGEG